MPHMKIWHFPKDLSPEDRIDLSEKLTDVLTESLDCDRDAVSIHLTAITPNDWSEAVFRTEIEPHRSALIKPPGYSC